MSLIDYWPNSAAVDACIKPEAEGASQAVLLAVHQPAPLAYRMAKSTQTNQATEEEFFAHFTTQNVPTGAHIVPITGDSGVGKSHLVRWLAARLSALPDADRYVVVSIAKSASLRRVVESIINLLPMELYGAVRNAFQNALSEIDPEATAIHFRSALEVSLRQLSTELRTQLDQNRGDQGLKERLDHAQRLPLLLSDAVTSDYFRTGPLSRIVRSAVAGRTVHDSVAEQFSAADFELPDDIDLAKASDAVRFYYRTLLQGRGGQGRSLAADVLNKVMDAAIRQSFHLNESLGGMTLQDVILEIRKLLLKEGRELVLLVEDFRALTGIQETLLYVLIQEGIRDGVQIYATMRSAIAVTEGYLKGHDTIATRATREWIVESRLSSEEEIWRRTELLVASYLNAARWGATALDRDQTRIGTKLRVGEINAPLFVTDDNDDVKDTLRAFGQVSGVPLFPLTSAAIKYLTGFALRQGDALVFRPRAIIGILRDVLLFGRQPFSTGLFPPSAIKALRPVDQIAQWLPTQHLSREQRDRYERLIVIWGNNPLRPSEVARIPAPIFSAFSLPRPIGLEGSPTESAPLPTKIGVPPPPADTPDDGKLTKIGEYHTELTNWVQEEAPLLSQRLASEIRTSLADALTKRIDWNQERCLGMKIESTQIKIPHARGSGQSGAGGISITHDRSDPDGELRLELLALVRFYGVYNEEVNYNEVDDDLARIGNMLERLLPDALALVRAVIQKQTSSAAAFVAANSRLLGITDGGRTAAALKDFLFGGSSELKMLPDGSPEAFTNWTRLQESARTIRPRLIEILQGTCGCYQGTGRTAHGVDIMRVTQAFSDDLVPSVNDLGSPPPELRESLLALSDSKVAVRARHAAAEANTIKAQLESKLGKSFDKHEVVAAILELSAELRRLGVWSESELGLSNSAFNVLCESFRDSALKEALNQLERLNQVDSAANAAAFIAQVSKMDFGPLVIAARFVTLSEKAINYGDRHAKTVENQYQDVKPQTHLENLRNELDGMVAELTEFQNDGSQHVATSRA